MSAAATTAGVAAPVMGSVTALLAVIFLIFALAWLIRRMQGGTLGGAGPIRLLTSTSVGAKERLVLISIGGEQMLLGVTASRIDLLRTIESPIEPAGQTGPFRALLDRHLRGSER